MKRRAVLIHIINWWQAATWCRERRHSPGSVLSSHCFLLRRPLLRLGVKVLFVGLRTFKRGTWWQKVFNYVFLPLKRWFQFNSRIVRTHFASLRTLNNWKMSYIFRWSSQCSRRRLCLSSLLIGSGTAKKAQNYKTREKLFPGNAKRLTHRNLTQRQSLLFQLQKTIKMSLIPLINFWFVASGVKM